ncbi:MAG: helix-turn-helix transcriptional regulator, partial [Actinobacteria bacterium]|nr:helix-turn-helix transcriptional regulator [Actinomycetota bacterium]
GSAGARAQAHYARAAALFDTGHPAAALEEALRGLDFAEQAGDEPTAYRLHTVCCDATAMLGDHERLRTHSQAGRDLLSTQGVAIVAGGASLFRVLAAMQAGEWQEALAFSDEDLALARRYNNTRLTVTVLTSRAWLVALRGELTDAEALLAEVKGRSGPEMQADRRGFGFTSNVEAVVAMEQDDLPRALAAIGDVDPSINVWAWAVSQAEVRARAGDLNGARLAVEAMAASSSPLLAAEAAYGEGLIRWNSPDPSGAAASLAESVGRFGALDMPFHAARARLERARTLVTSDAAAASAEAELALMVFDQLGAKRYAERARTVLGTLGVRIRPQGLPGRRSGLLSRREAEVALLVAEGLTNAEIAERLTVSVRTVTSHLDHIYSRLGINSRAALARHVATQPATL